MSTITFPTQINKEIKIVSKTLGVSRDVFTTNAMLFYLQSLRNKIALRQELDMWDKASEEDFLKFSKLV